MISRIQQKFVFLFILILIPFFLIILLEEVNTIFNVTAQTEIVSCYSEQKPISRINLFDANLYKLVESQGWEMKDTLIEKSFKGSIELSAGVNITMERVSNGSLLLEFEKPSGGLVAKIRSFERQADKPKEVQDLLFVEIVNIDSLINNNTSIVIPISGSIRLGSSLDIESDNEYTLLLRDGNIAMTGVPKISNSHFASGHEKLYLGDRLVLEDENSIGLATVNHEPSIHVSYRAYGKEARIIKPGPKDFASGYKISASIFSRFKYDKYYQTGSIIIALILSILTILDVYMSHFFDRTKKSKNEISSS